MSTRDDTSDIQHLVDRLWQWDESEILYV
jgi:hypothetical protein